MLPPPDATTVTLSNVLVFSTVVSWLVTAIPMLTFAASPTLVVPTGVHVTPSADDDAVNWLPLLTSFSQAGNDWVPDATNVVEESVAVRVMNSSPAPGRTSSRTWLDPAAVVSRIMTPAFANELV